MNIYRLLQKGKYKMALQQYDAINSNNTEGYFLPYVYPYICLCNGDYEKALAAFLHINHLEVVAHIGGAQPYLIEIGTMQWLLGQQEEALQTYLVGVNGIQDGTIEFVDTAGGAWQGLFLWYAGVSLSRKDISDQAIDFLKQLAFTGTIKYWPEPLVEYVIGAISYKEILKKTFGTSMMWKIRLHTKLRRSAAEKAISMFFFNAVKYRADGDEEGFRHWLRECLRYKCPNPMPEWYLAKEWI
jgi:hypothetical protein